MKIAYVEWLDARGMRGPVSRKEAEAQGALVVSSAGLFIREDAEVVTIAQDYWSHPDPDGTVPETVREIEIIPRVLVQRLEIVEISDKRAEEGSGWQQS